ncbi:hypothetical protein M422DRAFT_45200 [Sphaerobolus stellatus SS14]|nr:hypothetical protein M422DRAFT_45200 [Sphaerobolus stellatus SS14]
MPGGRPVKYNTLVDACEACLASKKAYWMQFWAHSNLEDERLKARVQTRLLTAIQRCEAFPPKLPALFTSLSITVDVPPEATLSVASISLDLGISQTQTLGNILPEFRSITPSTDCMQALSEVWQLLFNDPMPSDMDGFLQERASVLVARCLRPGVLDATRDFRAGLEQEHQGLLVCLDRVVQLYREIQRHGREPANY